MIPNPSDKWIIREGMLSVIHEYGIYHVHENEQLFWVVAWGSFICNSCRKKAPQTIIFQWKLLSGR